MAQKTGRKPSASTEKNNANAVTSVFTQDVAVLTGVGSTIRTMLAKLRIMTIGDLLWHLPVRYENLHAVQKITDIPLNVPVTLIGTIQSIAGRRAFRRRGLTMIEAIVSDESGSIKVIWFRQPYVGKQLQNGDLVECAGVLKSGKYGLTMTNPSYKKLRSANDSNDSATTEVIEKTLQDAIVPYYPLTAGLSQKLLHRAIQASIQLLPRDCDYLPETIRTTHAFPDLITALKNVHLPRNHTAALRGQQRLLFDRFFIEQLAIQKIKKTYQGKKAPAIPFLRDDVVEFVHSLPFELTDDQRKVAWQIIQDCEQPHPMNRLVIGDVGSGKTIVAAIAALNAIRNGFQVTIMAPTTILAQQHFETLQKFFGDTEISLRLITSDNRKNRKSVKILTDDLIVGTHALIQADVKFRRLGLAIVDEQHRFGVQQRKRLTEQSALKKITPHFLSLSATPIPRTLALTLYGDLDLSVITQMPVGRKPIITKIISASEEATVERHIQERAAKKEATFILCPLIEDSEKMDAMSVTTYVENLKESGLNNLRIGMLHGRMKQAEKDEVLEQLLHHKLDILVTTTVVEVGIDIPHATTMVIENAERFGLAQLHQLRGRVGRSQLQSHCFLKSNARGGVARERLEALVTEHRGMRLAEIDMELRGSGELYGTLQSGSGKTLEDAMYYPELLESAAAAAKEYSKTDLKPELELLVDERYTSLHRE